jgi:hypothetical protein
MTHILIIYNPIFETLDNSTHMPSTLYKREPVPQTLIRAPHNTRRRITHHHKVSIHSTTL